MMIKRFILSSFAVLSLCLSGQVKAHGEDGHHHHGHSDVNKKITFLAMVTNKSGRTIGTALLEETPKGVLMTVDVKDTGETGWRAIHYHAIADCSPLDGEIEGKGAFTNSGGHFNPDGTEHGFHHQEGAHAGDMPNIYVHEDGTAKVKILNTFVTLHKQNVEGRASLFDEDGSALIIHEGIDDYKSQPSGAAGPRFACAVIKQ